MALPDFTTQDATTYKTAIDDTAQDHENRIEQNEMDIADHGTRLTTVEEEINYLDDFYEETVLPLDGDFDDGELRIVRMGNVVTVSMSAISPPLPLVPSAHTTTDFLPSHLRPVEDVTCVFYMDAYGFIMAAIRSWGGFSIRAADYSGGNSNIQGAYGFSTSYITNYGWPSG